MEWPGGLGGAAPTLPEYGFHDGRRRVGLMGDEHRHGMNPWRVPIIKRCQGGRISATNRLH